MQRCTRWVIPVLGSLVVVCTGWLHAQPAPSGAAVPLAKPAAIGAAEEPPSRTGSSNAPASETRAPSSALPSPPAPNAATTATPSALEESDLRLYWLRDKNGELVPVPGFSLERFEELLRQKHRTDERDKVPSYNLNSVSLAGTVRPGHAKLTATVRFVVHAETWVRIPLLFNQAVLQGAAKYRGPGRHFLRWEAETDGYVAWVQGGVGQEHELVLELLVPLSLVGEETRLRLLAPRATNSELKLTLPQADLTARTSEGATLLPLARTANATTLTALGVAGDFEVAWRKSTDRPIETAPVLEVVGNLLATVDGQGVDLQGRLTVSSKSGPFDRFRVRLPKGAEFVSSSPSTLAVTQAAPRAAKPDDRAIVEVRLPRKEQGPVEIQLSARIAQDPAKAQGWCELSGFEVVDAVRDSSHRAWGYLSVAAQNPWHVEFGTLRGLRRVDELPEALRHEARVAGFEYFGQSFALPLRVLRRQSRVSVEPEHLVIVEANQLKLTSRLKYVVRTAEVSEVQIELPGWELEEAGPESLVAGAGEPDGQGVYSIPLAQRAIGSFEITLRARRPIAPGATSVSFELPRVKADIPAPATLVVQPGDDVELAPRAEGTAGLVRQIVAPPMKLPPSQQLPLFYRAETGKPVFSAGFKVHAQQVAVAANCQIAINAQEAQVEQKLSYTISYRAVDRLVLTVPRELAASEKLKFLLDEKPLASVELPEAKGPPDPARPVRRQLMLPEPRIGTCEITVRYAREVGRVAAKSSAETIIPLVMPDEGELSGHRVLVTAKEGIRVEPQTGFWTSSEVVLSRSPRGQGLQLQTRQKADRLPLVVHLDEQDSLGTTVVHRAWVQTWLTGDARRPCGLLSDEQPANRRTGDSLGRESRGRPGMARRQANFRAGHPRRTPGRLPAWRFLHRRAPLGSRLPHPASASRPGRSVARTAASGTRGRRPPHVLATGPPAQRALDLRTGRHDRRAGVGMEWTVLGASAALGAGRPGRLVRCATPY